MAIAAIFVLVSADGCGSRFASGLDHADPAPTIEVRNVTSQCGTTDWMIAPVEGSPEQTVLDMKHR